MDGRWTKANDAIYREYNKSPISIKKLELNKLELTINGDALQEAWLASGQNGAIPYGFVIPRTVKGSNGKTYREKCTWVDGRHTLNGGVFVHELLHLYSWPLPTLTRHELSEGLAEYFTRKIDSTFKNIAYNKYVTDVEDFIAKYNCEDLIRKWFFQNQVAEITQKVPAFVGWRFQK